MTLQGCVKGAVQQKLGSAGLMVGAILFGVSGFLMPHAAKPTSNLQEMLTPLGVEASRTQLSSLLMVAGFWAALIGATGVYRSMRLGGSEWARIGIHMVTVGTALWTVSLSLDVATASAVAKWLAEPASGKEAAWSVVAALNAIGGGVVPLTWIVYWLAWGLMGIGMIGSAVYPRWLGWTGLTLSLAVVALGVVQTFTTRSTSLTLIFAIFMLLTAGWDLMVGIWVARKAW